MRVRTLDYKLVVFLDYIYKDLWNLQFLPAVLIVLPINMTIHSGVFFFGFNTMFIFNWMPYLDFQYQSDSKAGCPWGDFEMF